LIVIYYTFDWTDESEQRRVEQKASKRLIPMQLNVEVRQSTTQQTAGSGQQSHPWMLGPIEADDGTRATPGELPYSFLAECECPDDCLRDHENE
jgi:hypothetical protein